MNSFFNTRNNIDDNDDDNKTRTLSIDNILKVIETVIIKHNDLKHNEYFSLLSSAHKCSFINNINLIKSSAEDLLSLNEMRIEDSKYGGSTKKRTIYEMNENKDSNDDFIITKKQMIKSDPDNKTFDVTDNTFDVTDEKYNTFDVTDEKYNTDENYLEEQDDYISEDTIKKELINSFYYVINSIKFTREFIKTNGHLYIDPDIINLYQINENINLLFNNLDGLSEIYIIKLLLFKHLYHDLQD